MHIRAYSLWQLVLKVKTSVSRVKTLNLNALMQDSRDGSTPVDLPLDKAIGLGDHLTLNP